MRNSFLPGILWVVAAGSLFAADPPRNLATKEAPFVNSLEMKFVPVPGTAALFCIWDTRVKDYAAYARAKTVDQAWRNQVRDGVPVSREPDYPVVAVSWDDANAFCQWLTKKETADGKLPKGTIYRLPTDEEWSRAAGLAKEDGATPKERSGTNQEVFPWGTEFPPPRPNVGNYADAAYHEKFPKSPGIEGYTDGYATTSPVGSFPSNQYGLYDMGGNVWQWCEDQFEPGKSARVLRGASFDNNFRRDILLSFRNHREPDVRVPGHGFRCVLAVAGSNSPSSEVAATSPNAPVPPSVEPPDHAMSTIEVLSKQAPNALEWALAPLDQTTPPDIRQNLTFLREDMLDEEAKKPAAGGAAYKLGAELCNDLLDTLNERDKMRVRAGYTAAQAKANMGEITNQALEARRTAAPSGWRNYGAAAMAWPTYQREKDQREELRKARENGAALDNQRPILEWADRSAQIRRIVDALYAQYRQAARERTAK